jgi:porphobilinogen synthase
MTTARPTVRPRRLRRTPALRRLVAETRLDPGDLILPLFVKEGLDDPAPIAAMPGVMQHSMSSLRKAARAAVGAGVGGLMLFGIPTVKDAVGSEAFRRDGILTRAIAAVAEEVGADTVVMSDVCLDEFTDHGHCGILRADGSVDNDATLERYAEMAVLHAEAGVDLVALSGMMDGQVAVVRQSLDGAGQAATGVIAYAAKYASGFYGPFREAVECSLRGDRMAYQMDPANGLEADREVALDAAEGADIVMVKPALSYLDVVYRTAGAVSVPVAAYQVSGEYSMIEAAAATGWVDRDRLVLETLLSVRRAGADMVLTYWAAEVAGWLA